MDRPTPDDVRRLAEFMAEHGLVELEIEEDSVAVRLRVPEEPPAGAVAAAAGRSPEGVELVSPMTGIFYGAPAPGQQAYVEVGDTVSAGDIVGLIEAMKVFNEITAEVSGRVVEILVGSEAHVREGDTLMVIQRH